VNDFSRLLNYAKQRYGDEPATLSMAAAANAGGWETYLLTPRQRRRYLHKRNREARRVTGAIRAGRA